MKKELYKNFDYARRVDAIREHFVEAPEKPVEILRETAVDSLLSVVYSTDERTGLPTGDLGYLVNKNANPDVRRFILDNIMTDVSSAANPSIPDGISDDLAFDLSRKPMESVEAYGNRINEYYSMNKEIIDNASQSVVQSPAETSVSAE